MTDSITVTLLDQTNYPNPFSSHRIQLKPNSTIKDVRDLIVSKVNKNDFVMYYGNNEIKLEDEHKVKLNNNILLSMKSKVDYTQQRMENRANINTGGSGKVIIQSNNSEDDDDDLGDDDDDDDDDGPTSGPMNRGPTVIQHFHSQQHEKPKYATGYVGLSNQGATCYLNSLLQTLYMTPEFRNALYNWSFEDSCRRGFEKKINEKRNDQNGDHGSDQISHSHMEELFNKFKDDMEKKSIPRQLQKLFLNLQLSDMRAIETTNLTSSFGWNEDEAFTQHDVQELMRVLFDALETEWKSTDKDNLINQLYQGEMKDYVHCLKCGTESSRKDTYLDIPLVIKGFGQTKAVGSVHEALSKFIEIEKLEGDNQYSCEKCGCKTDAEKGLSFSAFPYLLTLQLKRFDFDYNNMRRIKLNDRVTFPEILNMNKYLEGKYNTVNITDDESLFDYDDEDDRQSKRLAQIQNFLQNGKYVYELFSILIHRGSALGGHYYAYIKSFNNSKWYCFNDSSVTEISPDDIKDTFGENPKQSMHNQSRYASLFSSGSNAYMLMYRRVDPQSNIHEPSKESIPESLKRVFEEEIELKKAQQELKERNRQMVTLKVCHKDLMKEMKIHKDDTLKSAMVAASKELKLDVPEDCLRFREYTFHNQVLGRPYDDIDKSLDQNRIMVFKTLYLETKKPEEKFMEYDPSKMVLKVFIHDDTTGKWSESHDIYVKKDSTLLNLKEEIEKKYNIPINLQVISKEDYNKYNAQILNRDNHILTFQLRVFEGAKLWVEKHQEVEKSDDDSSSDEDLPKAFEEINRVKNTLEIYFTDPDSTEYKYSCKIDKNQTLFDLKKIIESKVGLSLDEFKVMRDSHQKSELRNEESKLSENNLYSGIKLLIEKGTPLRKGEITIKFVYFKYDNDAYELSELFKLPLPASYTVKEAKVEVVNHFKKLQENPETKRKDDLVLSNPDNLRFRELFGRYPSTILMDATTIKEVSRGGLSFSSPEIGVQILPPGETETKNNKDHVVVFMQQFFPSKWEVGNRFEWVLDVTEDMDDLRKKISEKTGCSKNMAISIGDRQESIKFVNIPKLHWIKPKSEEDYDDSDDDHRFVNRSSRMNNSVRLLRARDSEIVYFYDVTEKLKDLNDTEKKQLIAKDMAIRNRFSSSRDGGKEESLHIKQAEIEIDMKKDLNDN